MINGIKDIIPGIRLGFANEAPTSFISFPRQFSYIRGEFAYRTIYNLSQSLSFAFYMGRRILRNKVAKVHRTLRLKFLTKPPGPPVTRNGNLRTRTPTLSGVEHATLGMCDARHSKDRSQHTGHADSANRPARPTAHTGLASGTNRQQHQLPAKQGSSIIKASSKEHQRTRNEKKPLITAGAGEAKFTIRSFESQAVTCLENGQCCLPNTR